MKFTKLSLVAVLTVSSMTMTAMATEVKGKGQVYYYTTDGAGTADLFDKETTASAAAVTLDVSHQVMDNLSANFTAVGYTHLGDSMGENKMEGEAQGGYFNVANLTGAFGDTTVIAGRQLLDTPMLGSFDWLLAPSGFEAYTMANGSIENLTLVASYVNKMRGNNTGDNFAKLEGDNYAFGAAYSGVADANLWYYNVDAAKYTQIYGDVSKAINVVTLSGQVVKTDYDAGDDSVIYGAKIAANLAGFDISAGYNNVEDREGGMVQVDSMYTSSWNSFASQDIGKSWKVEAAKEFSGLSTTVSYADYETIGNEFDFILGYPVKDNVSLDAIYTNTKYAEDVEADNAIELIATYTF